MPSGAPIVAVLLVAALTYRGGLASSALTDGGNQPLTAIRSDQSHTVTAGLGLRF